MSGRLDARALHSRGIHLAGAHLIASCLLTPGTQLWRRDAALERVAGVARGFRDADLRAGLVSLFRRRTFTLERMGAFCPPCPCVESDRRSLGRLADRFCEVRESFGAKRLNLCDGLLSAEGFTA